MSGKCEDLKRFNGEEEREKVEEAKKLQIVLNSRKEASWYQKKNQNARTL